MKILLGKDYKTDLSELSELLLKEGIKHKLQPHPLTKLAPQAKKITGYFPAGDWQIIIKPNLSIIRGMISFGDYEIYDGNDIERTKTAKKMVNIIKKYLGRKK